MRYGTEKRGGGGMTVDYADVLRQAVENERFRVLREVYAILDNEPLPPHQYNADVYAASRTFHDRVKRKIKTLEDN